MGGLSLGLPNRPATFRGQYAWAVLNKVSIRREEFPICGDHVIRELTTKIATCPSYRNVLRFNPT